MARIDPSRRGGMDEPREKLGECRKNSNISKKSKKKLEKVRDSPSGQITLVIMFGYFSVEGVPAALYRN